MNFQQYKKLRDLAFYCKKQIEKEHLSFYAFLNVLKQILFFED